MWLAWVAWVCGCVGGVAQILALGVWVVWVHKFLTWVTWVTWVKKCVSDMGRNFGVGRVGFRCFVKKVLLKASQNLQESTFAGVSC